MFSFLLAVASATEKFYMCNIYCGTNTPAGYIVTDMTQDHNQFLRYRILETQDTDIEVHLYSKLANFAYSFDITIFKNKNVKFVPFSGTQPLEVELWTDEAEATSTKFTLTSGYTAVLPSPAGSTVFFDEIDVQSADIKFSPGKQAAELQAATIQGTSEGLAKFGKIKVDTDKTGEGFICDLTSSSSPSIEVGSNTFTIVNGSSRTEIGFVGSGVKKSKITCTNKALTLTSTASSRQTLLTESEFQLSLNGVTSLNFNGEFQTHMNFPVTFSGSSITVKTTGSVIPISTTTTTPVTLEFAKFPATLTGSLSTSVKLISPTALSSRSKVTFAGEFGGSLEFTSSHYDIVINNYTKTPSGSDFPFTFTVGAGGLSTLTINSALTTSISQNIIRIASESMDSLKKLTPSTYQLLTSPFTFTTTPELKLEKPSGVTDKIPGFEEGDDGFIEWKLDESGNISAAVKDIAHVAFRFCLGNSCESNQGTKVSNVNEISTYFKTDYKNLTVNLNGDSPSVHFAFLGPTYRDVEVNINGVNQAQTISQLNIPDAAPITCVNVLNIKAASDADEFLFSSKADAYVDTVFAQSSLSNIKKAPKSLNFNDIIVEYLEFSTTGVKITSGQIEGQTIPSFVTSPITFNLAQATASQLTYTMAEGLTSPQPVTVIFPTLETPSSYKIFLANWTQVDSTTFTMVINHGANPLEISATDSFQAEGSSHISLKGSGEVTYKNDGTVPTPLPPTQIQPSEDIPSVGPTLTGEPEPTNDEADDSDGKKNENVAVIASVTVVTVVIAVAIIVVGVIYFRRIRQGTGTGGGAKKEVTMSLYEV